jgi:hypothetical protein
MYSYSDDPDSMYYKVVVPVMSAPALPPGYVITDVARPDSRHYTEVMAARQAPPLSHLEGLTLALMATEGKRYPSFQDRAQAMIDHIKTQS